MASIIVSAGAAKLVDLAFTMIEAGLERAPIVDLVRKRELEGATLDQITDELQTMRQQSERDTQADINKMP